jgi:hypothetical protein
MNENLNLRPETETTRKKCRENASGYWRKEEVLPFCSSCCLCFWFYTTLDLNQKAKK